MKEVVLPKMGVVESLVLAVQCIPALVVAAAWLVRMAFDREARLEEAMEWEGEDGPTVRTMTGVR